MFFESDGTFLSPICAWLGELGSLELDGYQSCHRPEPSRFLSHEFKK